MTTVKTANYMLMEPISVQHDRLGTIVIPAGSFVSPVEHIYMPKRITQSYPFFNPKTDVFCYTKYGFHIIARHKLRAT